MKRNSKSRIVIGVILAVLILSYAGIGLYNSIKENDKTEEFIKKEYELLLSNDSVNSVVLSTYYPSGWRGGEDIQNVKFEDGTSYTIEIRTNITSQDMFFGNLVKPGVVLKKRVGSDTLNVINWLPII